MTGRIEKTVFISYRRTNFYTALAVYQDLTAHGYDVFIDYQSIDSGSFEKAIIENIKAKAHFLVVLSPSALERCKEPGDWLRLEIETAIDEKRNIVPLMMEGFDFGSPSVSEALSGKLAMLNRYNGLRLYVDYFFDAMEKLRNRFLKVEVEDARLHLVSDETKKINATNKSAAAEAAPVQPEQLTAEEWFERGYVFQNDKNLGEAIRCYQESLKLEPYTGTYSNLGVALTDLKRYDEAEVAYRKAIELNPSNANAYNNLGLLLHKNLKRFDEAEAAYRKAIEVEPSNVNINNNLGYLLNDLDRYKESEALLNKAIELNPSFAWAYNNLGNTMTGLKRYNEAEAAYRKAIELNEESPTGDNPSEATAYYNLGNLLSDLKRYDEAEAAYRKAIELNPLDDKAYNRLGILLSDLKRNDEAEDTYRKAIELNPSLRGAYGNLGNLLRDNFSNREDEAYVVYQKVIELNPSDDKAYYNLGILLQTMKRYEEAEAAYRKAIELNPSYDTAYNNLILLLRITERGEEAVPLLEKVSKINSEDFHPYLALASIRKQLGKEIPAEYLEKARQFIPEDDWYNRACLESVCDNFDLALEHLGKATQLEGLNPTWAWQDPDLQWIRNDPRFERIVRPKPE